MILLIMVLAFCKSVRTNEAMSKPPKTSRLYVRVSETEHAAIYEAAKRVGKTVSAWIRGKLLGGVKKP